MPQYGTAMDDMQLLFRNDLRHNVEVLYLLVCYVSDHHSLIK